MMLDSESKKRLIQQTRASRMCSGDRFKSGNRDTVARCKPEDGLRQSEQLYRTIFDGSRDAIFLTTADAKFVEVNEAASALTGYTREELKKMSIPDLHEEEDTRAYKQFFHRIMSGEQITSEARILRKDGTKVDTEFSNRKIVLGDAAYMHTVARDITERKQAEEALRISEAKYQDLYDRAPDMFVSVDAATGNILDCNQTTATKLGYKKEEIIGSHIREMYHPDSDEDRKSVFETFVEAGELHDAELQLKRKDGSRLDVSLNVSAVRDDQGKILYSRSIWRDISMRKQAEAALKESEEKYHLLVENAPSVLWKTSEKGITVFISSNIEEVYGYTPEEIYTDGYDSWFGRIRHDDLQEVERSYQALFDKGNKFDVEYRIKRKDGEWIWAHDVASVVREKNGERYAYGVFTDITEHKRAEGQLKSLSSIVEQSTEGMALADLNDNLIFVNKAWCKMHGYESSESLLGKNLGIFHNKKQLKNDVIPFNEEVKKNGTCRGEVGHITKDGKPFPTLMTSTLLKDAQGNPFAMAGIAKDITERKRLDDKAFEYQMQLKSLALQLSSTEECERHRLATELHDHIGQSLVFSKLRLDQLRTSQTSGELTEALEEVCNHLGQVIQDTRALTFDLSSPILYELGFEAAVAEWLKDEIRNKHGIEAEFEDDGQPKPLDDDIRTVLFRNVRELLVNTVKHAQARKVKVCVRRADRNIRVSVEDDGIGFDPVETTSTAAKRAKFGLFSIRQRLEQLGGAIEVDAEPGRGSRISMTAPLKQTKTDANPQTQ